MLQYSNQYTKLLYYLQRFGDLNPLVIGAISGIKDPVKLISELKSRFTFRAYPFVREELLGLKKYAVTLYFRKHVTLENINHIFDGTLSYALRDLLNPNIVNLSVYYNNSSFIKILDILLDKDIIYYYDVKEIKNTMIYPFDYSHFNYGKGEFEGISERGRFPFELPDLSDDFKPDYHDIVILGKKQARADFSLKDISRVLNLPFKEVLKHYQEHVIGKGLISAYVVALTKSDYRLIVKFNEEETLHYLSRIPEFYSAYKLDDGSYIGHIRGRNSTLIKYLEFISQAKREDDIRVNIHPIEKDYVFTASIPYEHYNGRWEFNTELMIMRAEEMQIL